MTKYVCEFCSNSFKLKGDFMKHLQETKPCGKIEETPDKVTEVKEVKEVKEVTEVTEVTEVKEVTEETNLEIVENNIDPPEQLNTHDDMDLNDTGTLKDGNIIVNDNLNYINDNNIIIHGDCLEKMKLIENDTIDLILCDLPYGTTRCKWDSVIDTDKLWIEYKRIIKKPCGVICLFGDQPFTSKLISSNYDWFKYDIIWHKNKTTQYLLANYRPMKCKEDILLFSPGGAAAASRKKGNMTYNPQGLISKNVKKVNSQKRIGKMLNQEHHLGKNNKLISNQPYEQKYTNYPKNIINFNIESNTIHETQKPVGLIEYLIKTYSNENDIVLDNTMGSGTTAIGCINTKRRFIGIEMNDEYYHLASERIMKHLENHPHSE